MQFKLDEKLLSNIVILIGNMPAKTAGETYFALLNEIEKQRIENSAPRMVANDKTTTESTIKK